MSDKFKNFITENLMVKVMALFLASVLWFFVVGEKDEEVGFMVPLSFKGIPENIIMLGSSPSSVGIRVKGPKTFIQNMNASEIEVELDLSDVRDGKNTMTVMDGEVTVPRGVKVVRVNPATVEVEMEGLVPLVLPINVKITGKPAEGYAVTEVNVTPKTTQIRGVKGSIKKLKVVETQGVSVEGMTTSASVTVPLNVSGKNISSAEPSEVKVEIEISKEAKREAK